MHIGKKIEKVVREQGRSVSWMAARIPCERTNVYNIFKRENIDINLLSRISTILNYDFFADISKELFHDT